MGHKGEEARTHFRYLFNKLRNKIRREDRPHLKQLLAALHEIVHRYKSLEAHLEYFEARLRETDATIRDIQTRNEKHLNELQSRVDEFTKAIDLEYGPNPAGWQLRTLRAQACKYARAYYDQSGDRINIDEWLRA